LNKHPLVGCDGDDTFPLKKRTFHVCSYKNVERFQEVLNQKSESPLLPIKEDGKFGKNTLERLERIYNVSEISKTLYDTEINKFSAMNLLKSDTLNLDFTYLSYTDLKSPIL
jgi:hypothetical protein